MVDWLQDAIFYEIYPQSFCDSNNDGIGDIQGMISKLDYIKDLGCNALWINPVYDSPFHDAGYDVRDYYKIADRYGTNEDMYQFLKEAHKRNIKVLMDLVPGHTSDEHEWFQQSKKRELNEYSDRYVWTNGAFVGIPEHPYISGMTEREGAYMLNFFASQPALNYGWGVCSEEWQDSYLSEAALKTREDLKKIMRFWLDHGCDGFRVDMADSLVKNDDDYKHATASIWRDVRNMLDQDYPNAALVSEWSNPYSAIKLGGFHMDFYLDHEGNGYHNLTRSQEPYFSKKGHGKIEDFLKDYLPKYTSTRYDGYISMFTCNHDTPRLTKTLTIDEIKLFDCFLLTMPGVPFIYYGDEIGMNYLDLPSVEGGYHRTGSRTPMSWNHEKNYGFSTSDTLYITQDQSINAPVLEDQINDEHSLYHHIKKWIHYRHTYKDLQADSNFNVLEAHDNLFIYERGNMVCICNSKEKVETIDIKDMKIIDSIGSITVKEQLILNGPSFVLLEK